MPEITMSARTSKPMMHELWCWSQFFVELAAGRKTFEIRKNDSNYQVGDRLLQKELVPCKKCGGSGRVADYTDHHNCCPHPHGRDTGKRLFYEITYMTNFAQREGWVVLAVKRLRLPRGTKKKDKA